MNCRSIMKYTLLTAVSSGVLLQASGVQAQQTVDEVADYVVFEEIIVTAGRREQSLQDVPAAVTAIAPEDFTVKGMQQIKDVLNYTTGIIFEERGNPGMGTIAARGVPQSSGTPVFGVYLDDTPLTSNTNFSNGALYFLDGLLMDIERVEVIKGPQGTLYGATSVGGMLRYISRDPALEEWRASAGVDISQVNGGGFGTTYNGRISAPLIEDMLGITVSGYQQNIPGYVDQVNPVTGDVINDNANDGTIKGYAADLLFTPTEELSVRLKYLKQENDSTLSSSVNLASENRDSATFGKYTTVSTPGPHTYEVEILSGAVEYDFGGVVLTSTTSKTEYEIAQIEDLTAAYGGYADLLQGNPAGTTTAVDFVQASGAEKIVQEVRLTSDESDTFEWIAGFYYTNEDTFNFQDIQVTPTFNMGFADFPSEYTEYAGFGDVTYYFNDKFDITAGVRVSKNEIVLNLETSGALLGESFTEGEVIKDTVKTYLLAGRYRVNDNLSFYTRIASGYRPAQPNIPVIDPETGVDIAPHVVFADKAWSYEIGAKGASENKSVSYEVAFWKIDWANFQAPVTITGVSTGGNAEDGLSAYGFESSVTLRPVDAFTVTANLGYTKSTLNSDEPTIGGGKGEDYPDLPHWKASVQWEYGFDAFGSWTGNFGGGFRYTGSSMSTFSSSLTQVPVELDSRVLADLNLSFTNDQFSLGLYATNLFNKRALVGRSDSIIGSTVSSNGFFERPRTIGANMRLEF